MPMLRRLPRAARRQECSQMVGAPCILPRELFYPSHPDVEQENKTFGSAGVSNRPRSVLPYFVLAQIDIKLYARRCPARQGRRPSRDAPDLR